jgi:oxygen-independent coproporphyrinogen-3 oxidase
MTAEVASADLPFEFMMNALRLNEGVDAPSFIQRTGLASAAIAAKMENARARGWLQTDAAKLAPTELGRRYLNDVVGLFLPDAA